MNHAFGFGLIRYDCAIIIHAIGDLGPAIIRAGRGDVEFVAAFSVMPGFEQFNNGQIDSRAVIYFLSVIGFPLFATSVIIRGLRA